MFRTNLQSPKIKLLYITVLKIVSATCFSKMYKYNTQWCIFLRISHACVLIQLSSVHGFIGTRGFHPLGTKVQRNFTGTKSFCTKFGNSSMCPKKIERREPGGAKKCIPLYGVILLVTHISKNKKLLIENSTKCTKVGTLCLLPPLLSCYEGHENVK